VRDTRARMVTVSCHVIIFSSKGEQNRWEVGRGRAQVSTKVDEVRVMMEGNINRLIDNAEALNQVEDKAGAASPFPAPRPRGAGAPYVHGGAHWPVLEPIGEEMGLTGHGGVRDAAGREPSARRVALPAAERRHEAADVVAQLQDEVHRVPAGVQHRAPPLASPRPTLPRLLWCVRRAV
jgi:hypothetical protein